MPPPLLLPRRLRYRRYEEMKHPYFTFLSPDNFYATTKDIDPQLLSESLKSYRSQTREEAETGCGLGGDVGGGNAATSTLESRVSPPSLGLEDPTGLLDARDARKAAGRAARKRFRIKSPLPTAQRYGVS